MVIQNFLFVQNLKCLYNDWRHLHVPFIITTLKTSGSSHINENREFSFDNFLGDFPFKDISFLVVEYIFSLSFSVEEKIQTLDNDSGIYRVYTIYTIYI